MHLLDVLLPQFADLLGQIFRKYVFSDLSFLGWLIMLVVLDTATGLYAAWRTSWIHSFKLRSICEKLFYYAVALVITHVLTGFEVDGEPNQIFAVAAPTFKAVMYLLLLSAEVLSIDENAAKVNRAFLPKSFRQKLKIIKETGIVGKETGIVMNDAGMPVIPDPEEKQELVEN